MKTKISTIFTEQYKNIPKVSDNIQELHIWGIYLTFICLEACYFGIGGLHRKFKLDASINQS